MRPLWLVAGLTLIKYEMCLLSQHKSNSVWITDKSGSFLSLPSQTTQRTTTQITTFSIRTCQPGITYPQYPSEDAWVLYLSLTASPPPQSPDSIPHIPASVLLHPSSRQSTGHLNPTKPTPYSHPASVRPLPSPRRSDAAPRHRPFPMWDPGCFMNAILPNMTTCQKMSGIPRHHSPFSPPSHPCPRRMGAFSSPNILPARMRMFLPALRHCQRRRADTVSEAKWRGLS